MKRITNYDVAYAQVAKMKYKELKGACISLGMTFDEIINGDVSTLRTFFIRNYGNIPNPALIEEFESLMKTTLIMQGHEEEDPIVKFSQFSTEEEDEYGNIKQKKKKSVVTKAKAQKKKLPVQKTKQGVRKGTKKAMAMEMAVAGKSKEDIIEAIEKEFGEVSPSSVSIWMRKAKK